jgi:hypothetical protein
MSRDLVSLKDATVRAAAKFHGLEAHHLGGYLWNLFHPRQDEPVGYIEYRADRSHHRWEGEVVCDQQDHFPLSPCDHAFEAVRHMAAA